MNFFFLKRITLSLCLLLIIDTIHGQCTIISTPSNGGRDQLGINVRAGQTFTAPCTGKITSIAIEVDGFEIRVGDIIVSFIGTGNYDLFLDNLTNAPLGMNIASPSVASVDITSTTFPQIATFNLTTPFLVTNGTTYRFEITNTTISSFFSVNSTTDFTNGTLTDANGSSVGPMAGTTFDLVFTIDIAAAILPEITGRDTTIDIGKMVDLSSLVTGNPLSILEYGTTFGTYNLGSSIQSPVSTTTYFVRDSVNTTGCSDTAMITVRINPMISINDSDGDGISDIADPCSCLDPLNIGNQTTNTLFHDIITVTNGGIGQMWQLNNLNAGELFQSDGITSYSIGTMLNDIGRGVYQLDVWHRRNKGFNVTFTRLSDNRQLTIGNTCTTYCNSGLLIPSMNQWGLFIFGLLIINLAVYFIHRLYSIKII